MAPVGPRKPPNELVDDQQLVGGERLLEPQQPLVVARLDHLMDDGRGGGEARLHPPLAGGEAEADHGVGLARARRPEGDDVLAAGDEVAPRQIEHQLLVEAGDGVEGLPRTPIRGRSCPGF